MTEQKNQSGVRPGPLLAQYKGPTELVEACKEIRDAGFTRWDAYSPYPVHGIDPAMGIKATILPVLIFGAGITGTSLAILMQWWMNAVDYKFIISGKPFFSLPANVPVAFELTVLFAALTGVLLTLVFNNLPRFHHPLFNSERFRKVTDDGFFIAIDPSDKNFAQAENHLVQTHPIAMEQVDDDSAVNAKLPRGIWYGMIIAVAASIVPLGMIVKARSATSATPRIHLNPNMDFQKKFKAQSENSLYADGRAMRLPIEGTVALGELEEDDLYYRGKTGDNFVQGYPDQVRVSEDLLKRGQERFDIYCAVCHGAAGYGDGPVSRRAEAMGEPKWVTPSSLHQDYIRQQANGQLFHTITHGIRNMNGYGHAIPTQDRWAIVAYIRALQRSQSTSLEDVPQEKRSELR